MEYLDLGTVKPRETKSTVMNGVWEFQTQIGLREGDIYTSSSA